MRPVLKTNRIGADGHPLEMNPYGSAKPELVNELGTFCSFCEKYNSRSALHVEHIFGKKCRDASGNLIYEHLQYRWDNFLLACVNCNGVKGSKDVAILLPYMPHENNLLCFIEIVTGGFIKIKNGVQGDSLLKARAFIDLVGLDRVPGDIDYSDRDDRWDNRMRVYDIAQRQLRKYMETPPTSTIETIVDLARTNGFFSIWYYLFHTHHEVIDALINGIMIDGNFIHPFPGTHVASFMADNNYAAIPRP